MLPSDSSTAENSSVVVMPPLWDVVASLEPRKEVVECLPNLDLFLEVGEMIFFFWGRERQVILKGAPSVEAAFSTDFRKMSSAILCAL